MNQLGIDKIKNSRRRRRSWVKCRNCWIRFSSTMEKVCESLTFLIIVFSVMVFSLLNVDVKLLTTEAESEPIFVKLNEVAFIVLLMDYLFSCLFSKNFLFSFFFYLDFLALLSMIPDTDFIMEAINEAIAGEHSTGSGVNLEQTSYFIKATSSSQTAAK